MIRATDSCCHYGVLHSRLNENQESKKPTKLTANNVSYANCDLTTDNV